MNCRAISTPIVRAGRFLSNKNVLSSRTLTTFQSVGGATKGIGCDDVTFEDLYRTKNVPRPRPVAAAMDVDVLAVDAKDMSIHGMCYKAVKTAAVNMAKTLFSEKKEEIKESHLGRWKVGIDNFKKGHSYTYDHTA